PPASMISCIRRSPAPPRTVSIRPRWHGASWPKPREGEPQMVEFLMGRGANALAVLLSCIVLLVAAFLGWIGYRDAATGFYAGAGVLVVIALLIPRSLRVANQWERAIVLRLGKLQAIRGPGLFFIVPFIDTIAVFIDQRIQTTQFNAERTLTRDTVPVNVDAIIFW